MRSASRCRPRGMSLYSNPKVIDLVDLTDRIGAHIVALMGDEDQPSFLFHPAQGFTRGGSADAEFVRDSDFTDPLGRPEAAVEEFRLYGGIDEIAKDLPRPRSVLSRVIE